MVKTFFALYLIRYTPVSHTHANLPHTNPKARKFARGAPHAKKYCMGTSPHIPHTIQNFFVFFIPTEKLLSFPWNSYASPCNPAYCYTSPCTFLHENMWKFAIHIEYLLSPRKNSTWTHPHTNCSHWYPSPHKVLSFCGSVRQGCFVLRYFDLNKSYWDHKMSQN